MRRALTSLLLAVLALCGQDGARAQAAPVQLCYEDAPQAPWTMPDGTGLNFELLKRVAELTGEQFVFVRRPWLRCQEETRLGRMDGMIGAADSPERRQFSRMPMLPNGKPDPGKALYLDNVSIFLRAGSGASWDGRQLHNPSGIVVTQRGYHVADTMRERGQRVIDSVKSADEALRLLVKGGADVAVLLERSAFDLVHIDPRFHGRIVKAALPFSTAPFHLMIANTSYQQNPRRFEAIWEAIAVVRARPDYRRLEAAQTRRTAGQP